jgi:hypothetical protein
MGLPVLSLDPERAAKWRTILEEKGLNVELDQSEIERERLFREKHQKPKADSGRGAAKWQETPWLIASDGARIAILEVNPLGSTGPKPCLVFAPSESQQGRELSSLVQGTLRAAFAEMATTKDD